MNRKGAGAGAGAEEGAGAGAEAGAGTEAGTQVQAQAQTINTCYAGEEITLSWKSGELITVTSATAPR